MNSMMSRLILKCITTPTTRPLISSFHTSAIPYIPLAEREHKMAQPLTAKTPQKWSLDQTEHLEKVMNAMAHYKRDWSKIAKDVKSHKSTQCARRWYYCVRKNYVTDTPNKRVYVKWTEEMISELVNAVAWYDKNKIKYDWTAIIKRIGNMDLSHTSCRGKLRRMGL